MSEDSSLQQIKARELIQALYALAELEFGDTNGSFPFAQATVRECMDLGMSLSDGDFHSFAVAAIREIAAYCANDQLSPGALYRAFDAMDEVLEIKYDGDHGMIASLDETERLYEGAAAGVQTSYTSILKVLEYLELPQGGHLIDLGSGFGRVGLAVGLWRDDLHFTGYEYVGHRIEASRHSARRAGVDSRVRFFEEDLSRESFVIPEADAYYLYDPFSESTYRHVLARLLQVGREREIQVVAKAGARDWFRDSIAGAGWEEPAVLDEGTLLVFRSPP